ncbi:HAD family hydrolase [Noviherbaspirillum aerium]|uniref:HAD family hydrolase n=1 Tax=Noviherbaspirillum aerium TaxID=2588497 RepID=UPI00124D7F22|nr:HAD hydrolase-like protein [Noviherbaspirillum aerium]
MGIELLILTLDGVMFDTEDAHRRACNIAFKACGTDLRWNIADFRAAAASSSAAAAIAGANGVSPRAMKSLLQEKHNAFHTLVLDGAVSAIGECMSLVKDALAAGCKLAVVTDLPARTTNALLEQAYGDAVNDMFSVVASGADLRHASGNGPYHLAMRTVGVEAAHTAAIETSMSGLNAARAAGIWTFAAAMQGAQAEPVNPGSRSRPYLRDCRDLSGAKTTGQPDKARMLGFDMLCMLKQQQPEGMPPSGLAMPTRLSA